MSGDALLVVDDLTVTFAAPGREPVRAVDGVGLTVAPGQTVGIVGESGCGKSVTALAIMGLLPARGARVTGTVTFDGTDLLALAPTQLAGRRGRDLAMVFQDPLSALNPVMPVGRQVAEVLERHRGLSRRRALAEATDLLGEVGIAEPARRRSDLPHQLSGGMRQRALIAMALACRPRLLLADEPTTALDVTVQAQILALLAARVRELGTALVLITHDLGVVAGLCDEVNVLYRGRVVERAGRHELFASPRHPYTHGLLASVPRLDARRGGRLPSLQGSVDDAAGWDGGCAFAPRCPNVLDDCRAGAPALADHAGRGLRCVNPVGGPGGNGPADRDHATDGPGAGGPGR